jgi:hypothetical protein
MRRMNVPPTDRTLLLRLAPRVAGAMRFLSGRRTAA